MAKRGHRRNGWPLTPPPRPFGLRRPMGPIGLRRPSPHPLGLPKPHCVPSNPLGSITTRVPLYFWTPWHGGIQKKDWCLAIPWTAVSPCSRPETQAKVGSVFLATTFPNTPQAKLVLPLPMATSASKVTPHGSSREVLPLAVYAAPTAGTTGKPSVCPFAKENP